MPRILHLDLSTIADRVHPQTWHLFQTLRTRMRQMKGVTMQVDIEKTSLESIPCFRYGDRELFRLKARGEELNATIHADEKAQSRIIENQALDPTIRDQIRQNNWADFTLKCSKDIGPFMEVVKVKYALMIEDLTTPKPLVPEATVPIPAIAF